MTDGIRLLVEDWLRRRVRLGPVADLGGRDINGGWRSVTSLPVVGFDLEAGPGVDVVLEPGEVPAEHRGLYPAVVATSALQFAPDPAAFLREAEALSTPGAVLLVTVCPPWCHDKHRTSLATAWVEEHRWHAEELIRLLARAWTFERLTIYPSVYVYEGRMT